MFGENIEVKDILNQVKKNKPASLILGSHHFVQMSGTNIESTGITKNDLENFAGIS